jgi:hypothetical protein
MRFGLRIPRFASSSVEAGPAPKLRPVLDGSDVVVPNRWKIAPHTVALVGRPAVYFQIDVHTPRIGWGWFAIPSARLVWEQDFGGHLFIAITDADDSRATIVEAGPLNSSGTGNLVPYAYPEDQIADKGIVDFEPIVIPPPHGMSEEFFAGLVRTTQRAYDGDQLYRAVEIPFLRVGRDSNSYAVGVLLCCGVDPREIAKPKQSMRWEWTGYPGTEDPVHRANFGAYIGTPNKLADDVIEVAHHDEAGGVRYVVVAGAPNGKARLPDGSEIDLDPLGRAALMPDDARRHGLPTRHTDPPDQIRRRRRFPENPSPAGAEITLIVDERPVPLEPGTTYRGRVVERHDGLGLARLRTSAHDVVLPLAELGIELRDPKRVDRLLQVGTEVTLGLRRDRHPALRAHGLDWFVDRIRWRRIHLPRTRNVVASAALGVALLGALAWLVRRP